MKRILSKRTAADFFIFGFSAYGVLWTIVKSIGTFFPNLKIDGYWYAIIVVIASGSGLWRAWPRNHVELRVPASDSSLEIRFGNIFDGGGVVVIPVNEYFDGELGDHVSERSLHGQFIQCVLGGQSQSFYDLINKDLKSVPSKQMKRESGRCAKYPIGTVARADIRDKRYLLVALSRTNIKTLKASATVHELWDCLAGTWQGVRNYSGGNSVKVPLFGSGLSGVGLSHKFLIDLIAMSFLYYTKEEKIADKVTLVLPSKLKGEIDLVATRRSWTNGI